MTHLDAFADALITAHKAGTRCAPDSPAPVTPQEAYYVQSRVAAALGPLAGFKCAQKPGEVPIMAPVLNRSDSPIPLNDHMGLELEVGWKIMAPLPTATEPDFDALLTRCILPVPVIELVDTRLNGPIADDPIAKLADFQINNGLIVGTPLVDWDGHDFGTFTARMQAADQMLLEGRAQVPGGSALSTLKTLMAMIGVHCGGIQVGQIVITGSLHPLTYVDTPCQVHGEIDGLGTVAATLV